MTNLQLHAHPAVRLLSRGIARKIFSPLMRGRTPIFMLHRLHDPVADVHGHTVDFIKCSLAALRDSGAKFISLRTLIETWRSGGPVDPDWVVFTLDDGFEDQAILTRDAFAPMKCPVTIFLISGFLDGRLWPWDDRLAFAFRNATVLKTDFVVAGRRFSFELGSLAERLKAMDIVREHCKKTSNLDLYAVSDEIAASLGTSIPDKPPPWFRPMTWDTARTLEREGIAEFGPHSVTHQIFSRMSDEQAKFELESSWSRVKQELRNPVPVFAWPTGRQEDFSDRDIAIARELGLQACVATRPGYAHVKSDGRTDDYYRVSRFGFPTNLTAVLRYGSWLERGRELLPI